MRSKKQEEESLKVERYLSGLKWNIQEELSLWDPTTVQRCHQLEAKAEIRKIKEEATKEKVVIKRTKEKENAWSKLVTTLQEVVIIEGEAIKEDQAGVEEEGSALTLQQ